MERCRLHAICELIAAFVSVPVGGWSGVDPNSNTGALTSSDTAGKHAPRRSAIFSGRRVTSFSLYLGKRMHAPPAPASITREVSISRSHRPAVPSPVTVPIAPNLATSFLVRDRTSSLSHFTNERERRAVDTMGRILAEAAAQQNVLDAWNTTKSRLAWEPASRAEVQAFTVDLLAHLTAISSHLENRSWTPQPLRRVDIPKSSGGTRTLGTPSLVDRVTERALAAVIARMVDPQLQSSSYGFRPGLGVDDAVEDL